jgi:putative hydrolase of the HAD superfamily
MLDGVRWILFDAVGTLMFPDPPVAEAYFAAAARFGSRLSLAEIQKQFPIALEKGFAGRCETNESHERRRWRSIVGDVLSDIPVHVDAVFEQLWQHFAEARHWRLFDDVETALGQLRRRHFRLGIASNFDGRLKNIVSGHSALLACEVVFVSSEIGYSKPDPRFFRTVQQQLGVDPGQIALVGDDEACDVQAAIAAGWRAIHLDRNSGKDGAIRSLTELH